MEHPTDPKKEQKVSKFSIHQEDLSIHQEDHSSQLEDQSINQESPEEERRPEVVEDAMETGDHGQVQGAQGGEYGKDQREGKGEKCNKARREGRETNHYIGRSPQGPKVKDKEGKLGEMEIPSHEGWKKPRGSLPPTRSVFFVNNTSGGELARSIAWNIVSS